jgi:uncharacterized Tic20 family protein
MPGIVVLVFAVCRSALGQQSTTQYYATTPGIVNYSSLDTFLSFPPEYVALLGLGIAFLLLYVVVMIIICMTARGGRRYK